MTMHDVFWFGIFPLNAFALGLCLGRYLTEMGVIPIRRRPAAAKNGGTDG
jgi:hypothetical protein